MPKGNLTAKAVERLKPDPSKRIEVPDGIVSGLYLVVQPKGSRSWALRYRFAGRTRKLTLGQYPTFNLVKAREKAREAHKAIQAGEDPARAQSALKASVGPLDTVTAAFDRYLSEYCRPNVKRWQETQRLFDLYILPAFGNVRLAGLSKWEVREVVRGVVDAGKPVQANRVLAAFKAFLNWCIDEDLIDSNPAAGVRRPTKERERDRVLSNSELREILRTANDIGYPPGPLISMLALTGQRRDEVRCATWSEIDLDQAIWTLPAERTKNGHRHVVPLSQPVLDLLQSLPRFEGPYIFSASGGTKPYANLVKPKRTLDEASGVIDWTLHDLRRSAATGMAAAGIASETIARVLNHAERQIAGVTARYARADHTDAKRRALEAWATHCLGLTVANVVPPRGGA